MSFFSKPKMPELPPAPTPPPTPAAEVVESAKAGTNKGDAAAFAAKQTRTKFAGMSILGAAPVVKTKLGG